MRTLVIHMQPATSKKIISATRELYDTIAPEFAATRSSAVDFTGLTRFVKPGQLVLDAGCGNGRLVEVMRAAKIKMIGCDNARALLALAEKTYAAEIAAGWLGFTVAELTALPFDKQAFNVVFILAVLHHLPGAAARLQVLRDLRACTRPSGQLVGAVWNLRAPEWQKRYQLTRALEKPAAGLDPGDVYIPWKAGKKIQKRYCHAFTPMELRALLRAAGWQVMELYEADKNLLPATEEGALNIFWVAKN